jgi:putative transposase
MRKSKFTDSQIMDAAKRVEAGFGVPDLCRDMEASIFILFSFWEVYAAKP